MTWCFTNKLCTRRDAWVGALSWRNCQSPASNRCGLLNHLNSFHRGMFKLKATLVQIHCSNHSVILNVMATQYTCSLNVIYLPHWLVQWGCHFTHEHSSLLSLTARLHWNHANRSHYINSSRTFSGQTSYSFHTSCLLWLPPIQYMWPG